VSDYHTLVPASDAAFDALPLVVEGESKIVRRLPDHPTLCVIRFKPTIYSFTQNRAGVVPGSERLRLRATRVLVDVLRRHGVAHAYRHVDPVAGYVVADLVADPPPIEVIVKAFHGGTSKHRYHGMGAPTRVRPSHPYFAGAAIVDDGAYPVPQVRFDWRNPLVTPTGVRLADEVMGDDSADLFIDTRAAKLTAQRAYRALAHFLGDRDVVVNDLCLFVTHDGQTVFGEISQDCGRFRHFDPDIGSLDKDVWRAGGSSTQVLAKWEKLCELIED